MAKGTKVKAAAQTGKTAGPTSGELAIREIALSGRRRGLPAPMDGHRDIWFDVTVTVENPGREPLHVVSELRGISYDAAQRVLTLRLAEAPPGPRDADAPTFTLPTPATVTVPPGGTAEIKVAIPAILKELQPVPGEPFRIAETDLRGMRTIRCEVASSDTPIGRMERLNPDVLRSRLATWGRIIQSEAAVTPDTRD